MKKSRGSLSVRVTDFFSRDSGELERRYVEYLKFGHNVFELMLDFSQLYAVEQVARDDRRYLKDLSEIAQIAHPVEVGFFEVRLNTHSYGEDIYQPLRLAT